MERSDRDLNSRSFFRLRKLSLFETNKSTNLLTDRMMNDVERLINSIAPIITDIETFKLLCLITLFTGVGDTMPTIAKLRNRFVARFCSVNFTDFVTLRKPSGFQSLKLFNQSVNILL